MSSPIDTSISAAARQAATLDALAEAGEQSGWHVLDTARAQQFTGEIVFQTQPMISVYFDFGSAYYAVRAGDPSLCERLVEVGVVEPAQIERGVIRVGNVENLGRLFDRDPSVDRDAVMVVLEIATDDVVSSVANTVTSSFTSTAYRHHASGVHRWFVAPSDHGHHVPTQLAPVGEVAQIDASVTSDLPGLAGVPEVDDDVHIEWDQPLGDDTLAPPTPVHTLDESMLQAILDAPASSEPVVADEPFADPIDSVETVDQALDVVEVVPAPSLAPPPPEAVVLEQDPADVPGHSTDHLVAPPSDDHDQDAATVTDADHDALDGEDSVENFQIVWPDGSEQALLGPDAHCADEAAGLDLQAAWIQPAEPTEFEAPTADVPVDEQLTPDASAKMPIIVPADEVVSPTPEPVPEPLSFELPPLAVSEDNLPDDHQPEEVVDAVRRALEAIEAASAAPARLASVAIVDIPSFEPVTPLEFDVVDLSMGELSPPDVADESAIADSSPVTLDMPVTLDAPDTVVSPFTESIADPVSEPFVRPVVSLPSVSALESALPRQTASEVAVVDLEVSAPAVDPIPADAPTSMGGFAPPTMHDSAEAVYARAAQDAAPAGPAAGVASVVFVDEEPAAADDRSGALQRLIGSLRRK